MEIITGTTDFTIEDETAVAIGKFDGVHVGHRRLLEEILEQKKNGRKACVFTFDPPPSVFFHNPLEKALTTKEEKRLLFSRMGMDILIEYPLNAETAAVLPQVFIREMLCGGMNAGFVAAGTDVSFGAGGAGNAALLRTMAAECGYQVKIIDKVLWGEQEISSSLIREAVEKGDMPLAEKLLGTPFFMKGRVQEGNHIGRTLGMPTVNLLPPADKLLPPNGVYTSGVLFKGRWYRGISNIGCRPTIEEKEKRMGVETYLYGFDEEAYGAEIEVYFYAFKRPEQRFESMEALKAQIARDVEEGASDSA